MSTIPDTESQMHARSIMSENFFGPEEVRKGFHIAYTNEQLRRLAKIPFSEETLRSCKETHVLVAGSALSLNEIRKMADEDFFDTNWYGREPFANDTKVSVRWYLIRRGPVPKSFNKTYKRQCSLLTKDEEVPFACEMTYMVMLYWLKYGVRPLPNFYVRCQDMDSGGFRVRVGEFDSTGFDVRHCWDGERDCGLGLASSVPPRKP